MINYLNKKLGRLLISRNFKRLYFAYHFITGGFKAKKINISFENKKSRVEIIQNIIDLKNYSSYLEIGTFQDQLFSHVNCKKKIGVDPVSGGNVRKTSDQFFFENEEKFDCIFIDGLHYYSQVKKDISNSLKILNPNGIILLHDCLPNNHFEQAVPRCQMTWNGDVWKAIVECRTIDQIDTYTCYADYGIAAILKRKNKNILDINTKDFSRLKFEDYYHNFKSYMNIIEFDDLIKII